MLAARTDPTISNFRFIGIAAFKKLTKTIPDNFEFFRSEAVDGGFIVEGSEYKILSRGPRKGKPKFDRKNSVRVLVTEEDVNEAELQYEKETGKCYRCFGTSQVGAGWSIEEGRKYRPCPRCDKKTNATTENHGI